MIAISLWSCYQFLVILAPFSLQTMSWNFISIGQNSFGTANPHGKNEHSLTGWYVYHRKIWPGTDFAGYCVMLQCNHLDHRSPISNNWAILLTEIRIRPTHFFWSWILRRIYQLINGTKIDISEGKCDRQFEASFVIGYPFDLLVCYSIV